MSFAIFTPPIMKESDIMTIIITYLVIGIVTAMIKCYEFVPEITDQLREDRSLSVRAELIASMIVIAVIWPTQVGEWIYYSII